MDCFTWFLLIFSMISYSDFGNCLNFHLEFQVERSAEEVADFLRQQEEPPGCLRFHQCKCRKSVPNSCCGEIAATRYWSLLIHGMFNIGISYNILEVDFESYIWPIWVVWGRRTIEQVSSGGLWFWWCSLSVESCHVPWKQLVYRQNAFKTSEMSWSLHGMSLILLESCQEH